MRVFQLLLLAASLAANATAFSLAPLHTPAAIALRHAFPVMRVMRLLLLCAITWVRRMFSSHLHLSTLLVQNVALGPSCSCALSNR